MVVVAQAIGAVVVKAVDPSFNTARVVAKPLSHPIAALTDSDQKNGMHPVNEARFGRFVQCASQSRAQSQVA